MAATWVVSAAATVAHGWRSCYQAFYRDAGCGASEVGYVASQGTETLFDDPIEGGALSAILRESRQPGNTVPERAA